MPRRKAPTTLADLPVPESSIQRAICDYLKLDGWRVFETDAARRHHDTGSVRHPLGEVGMCDLLCCRYICDFGIAPPMIMARASVMWVEVKRLSGKSANHQSLWQRAERARGALVIVLGEDCEASIEGWLRHYKASGLNRRL